MKDKVLLYVISIILGALLFVSAFEQVAALPIIFGIIAGLVNATLVIRFDKKPAE